MVLKHEVFQIGVTIPAGGSCLWAVPDIYVWGAGTSFNKNEYMVGETSHFVGVGVVNKNMPAHLPILLFLEQP